MKLWKELHAISPISLAAIHMSVQNMMQNIVQNMKKKKNIIAFSNFSLKDFFLSSGELLTYSLISVDTLSWNHHDDHHLCLDHLDDDYLLCFDHLDDDHLLCFDHHDDRHPD